jgi:D-citramalate synthase
MCVLFESHPDTRSPATVDDVRLLDTTLRDGEQAPGVSLTPDEKAHIAQTLDSAGIDVIEAGSACTGPGERDAIRQVTDRDLSATVTSFCRGVRSDVDQAIDCDVDGISLVVPASEKHVTEKVGVSHAENVAQTVELVEYATDHGLWVEVIGEDGSRADLPALERLLGAALDAGADRICYADTVGHATPDETLEYVSALTDLGPTSTHTHDDLGLAVTNALVSVAAGADLVHATVNGIGERAGNVAIEEVAVALEHGYDVDTMELDQVYDLAQVVANRTGVSLAPNKAIVGENAFTHESGIHTDGTLKDEAMYEPFPPEMVGRTRRLTLGKHAGRAGVSAALDERGVSVTDQELDDIVARVTAIGDRGKRVTDADLLRITEEVRGKAADRRVEVRDLSAISGVSPPTASVRLAVDGETRESAATGSGPVDAAMNAVVSALGHTVDATLESFHVDAITGGTDAVVTVDVTMSRNDETVTVSANDSDITSASVSAMVDAIDRLMTTTADTATAAD